MGSRIELEDKMALLVPGPGNYSAPRSAINLNRSVRFANSKKLAGSFGEATKTPAPGAYESIGAMVRTSPQRFGFGKVEREIEIKKSSLPGPGNYEHKKHVGNDGPR